MNVPLRVQHAARILRAGGVVAYPTEAVWGLGCDPNNAQAVHRLLTLKDRPVDKGLILVAGDIRQFDTLLQDIPADWLRRLNQSWPGPRTWLIPHNGQIPQWICGRFDTVAVRVSAHPVVASLCKAFGGPLVSTSANPAGAQPARQRFAVQRYFGDALDALVPGSVGALSRPSQIGDLRTGQIIRR